MLTPLIDADVLRYEVGFCGEYVDENGEHRVREWEFVKDILHERIDKIIDACWATEEPVLYLTYDRHFHRILCKERARKGLPPVEYAPNFRYGVAKTKPYKQRGNVKPFHYNNLTAYMLSEFNCKIIPGLEADDAICIDQCRAEPLTTIICTRDKDLRMVPGLHYGWECGKQAGFGPKKVDQLGWLELDEGKNKITGAGMLFFFYQMVVGDSVDTIPGLPKGGPALAWKHLSGCKTIEEAENAVVGLYRERLGESWQEYFEEQSKLLWMVRELTEDGKPITYGGKVLDMRVGEPVLRRDF